MVIGLTGGIGCGKTAVAACFARRGFQVVDADALAREVLASPACVAEMRARFPDLDLILIYDFDHEQPDSDGERSLHGAQYFARFTQRLISALSSQTNYGALYHVDMRLRPSGRSGPVATSLDAFASYQESEAWTWEHMALTRARPIAGPQPLKDAAAAAVRKILTSPRDPQKLLADVADMRQRMARHQYPAAVADCLRYTTAGAAFDGEDALRDIACPTLVIGSRDRLDPARYRQAFRL